ncbi:Radical SAM domain protein [Smithella sp. ME-1]|uniref:Radical sam domain heme biosynthesis protein n=1 Tax=hydrocarbon metagenome TaxID=938273 RepID=A0A0W8FRY1_9ZZZZ|nr:Radical SAM domain protein [Smithella sp. ME-1]
MNLEKKNIAGGLLTIYQARINRLANKPIEPKVLAYSVTWRCNAGCSMCGLSTMDNSLKDINQELTSTQIGNAFGDKNLHSLDLIRFTGGEPFLKDDFTQIVHQIWEKAKPKLFYITTNGTFTDKIKDFVKSFQGKNMKLSIQVSLDAVSETHDQTRGVPGMANKAIETLEMLTALKKTVPVNIGINQAIIRENADEIESVNQLAKKMGVEHKVYVAVTPHESDILSKRKKQPELKLASHFTEDEKKQLYEKIEKIMEADQKSKDFSNINYIWHLVEKFLREGERKRILKEPGIVNLPCLAGFLYLRLLPNGDIMPCTIFSEPMGNIKEKSFSEIWHSEKADSMRKQVKNCRGCWVECDIVSNFVYSDYMLKYFIRNIRDSMKRNIHLYL